MPNPGQERVSRLRLSAPQPAGLPPGAELWQDQSRSPGPDFTAAATELLRTDPRIASVSWADSAVAELVGKIRLLDSPLGGPPGCVHASAPAGDAVLLSAAARQLAGPWLGDSADSVQRWAHRANSRGLRHVWWTSMQPAPTAPTLAVAQMDAWESREPTSAIAALVDSYRARNARLTVAVACDRMGPHETGGQVASVSWIAALAQRPDVAEVLLCDLPTGELPAYASALSGLPRVASRGSEALLADIYWRPFQPDPQTMLSADRRNGRRMVTTYLDLIEYANAQYHPDAQTWYRRRRQLRRYSRQVDAITTISRDVLEHLELEVPGLELERCFVTPLGVDHLAGSSAVALPSECADLAGPDRPPFLLVLGNDFQHKNRDLAIAAWGRLDPGTDVDLVLAGLHVGPSSSATAESVALAGISQAPGRIVQLDHVSPQAKSWLLANAAVVLYPSSAEGFGFVPHEAAQLGTPTLFTRFGPLQEFLPDGVPGWLVEDYTAAIQELLGDSRLARSVAEGIAATGAELTWARAADRLVAAFRSALAEPPQPFGLWERTESGELGDPCEPLPPDRLAVAAHRAEAGRLWRVKGAVGGARARAGAVKRRIRGRSGRRGPR